MNFVEKRMIKMVKAETGDFRDWDAIAAWAGRVATDLGEVAPSSVGGSW